MKQKLSGDFLKVKLHGFGAGPTASPGHERQVFRFQIQESGPAPTEHAWGCTTLSQGVRHFKARHNSIPFIAVCRHGGPEQLLIQGHVSEQSFKEGQSEAVLQTAVLPAGEASRLGIANVHIGDPIRRKGIGRKDEVTTREGDELRRMQHTQETNESYGSPVVPVPQNGNAHSGKQHGLGNDRTAFAGLGLLPFFVNLPGGGELIAQVRMRILNGSDGVN